MPSLNLMGLANYELVSNVPFLGKVLECMAANQLQEFLDEMHYLDPFQSGFNPGYGIETDSVTWVDDLHLEMNRGSVSLLVLLDDDKESH